MTGYAALFQENRVTSQLELVLHPANCLCLVFADRLLERVKLQERECYARAERKRIGVETYGQVLGTKRAKDRHVLE